MKTFIYHAATWINLLAVPLLFSLYGCGDKNPDNPEPEEHCTGNFTTGAYEMELADFHYTYFAFKEGDNIRLRYSSDFYSGVCPKKEVRTGFNCFLLLNQPRTITVTAGLVTGLNENLHQFQLVPEVQGATIKYTTVDYLDFDLSVDYPEEGAGKFRLVVDFTFLSSGDVTANEEYFKSMFQSFRFDVIYFPY